MTDERLDNEDLENLQPEDQSATDRIAEEAGQITRELGERPVRDYVRRRTDEYRDRIRDNLDGIRKARREQSFKSAKELGQGAVDSAAEGLAGRGLGRTAAAEGAAGTAAATTGSTAAGAATTGAATQVAGQAAVQTGAKAVSSTGIKAIAGSVLNFAAPVVGFIVGWIIGELVLKIPVIGKFLEKVGELGCKIILMGCQILVVVAMALIGIFIATVMGLASLGHWGSSPTKPIDTAKAEHRNQLELVWCLTTKDSTALEEPPIKEGEENSEDANKDSVQTKTAEVKTNDKESKNPQLTPECVAANAKMVDQALKAIEKQVAYFEQIKPKNLDALKKAYDELKKQGQAIKDAGSDLNKARTGTEKFATAYKLLQAELSKLEISCDDVSLSLGTPNRYGLVQLKPSPEIVFYANGNYRTSVQYVTPKMACWMAQYSAAIKREFGVPVEWGEATTQNGTTINPHQTHVAGGTADFWISGIHDSYSSDRAFRAAQIARQMGAVVLYATTSDPKLLPLIDPIGSHADHWHVCIHDCL